jgi:hypothetical protein
MVKSRLGGLKVSPSYSRELAANFHLAPGHIDKATKVAGYCQPRTPEATGKILKAVTARMRFMARRPFIRDYLTTLVTAVKKIFLGNSFSG